MSEKRCTKCGEVKPFEGFYRHPKGKDGLSSECKACHANATKDWKRANPGKQAASNRAWRQANPDKHAALNAVWAAFNPEKVIATRQTRRARKAGVESTFTAEELKLLIATQGGFCAYCQRSATLQIDHIWPLKRNGPNTLANICLACARCNLEKGAKTLDEWVDRWYYREWE